MKGNKMRSSYLTNYSIMYISPRHIFWKCLMTKHEKAWIKSIAHRVKNTNTIVFVSKIITEKQRYSSVYKTIFMSCFISFKNVTKYLFFTSSRITNGVARVVNTVTWVPSRLHLETVCSSVSLQYRWLLAESIANPAGRTPVWTTVCNARFFEGYWNLYKKASSWDINISF